MTADIWAACGDQIQTINLSGEVFRVVESQEQIATNSLVDDLAEQAVLEHLLEASKPGLPASSRHLSYLLFTPFRYPPLKYGSRFGSRYQPSLFYASRQLVAALAETAYYRLYFWQGMASPPAAEKLTTQHTAFTVDIQTSKGLQLQQLPFADYESQLTSKRSYQATQLLGTQMREQGIEAFEYISARDSLKGINLAIFVPQVFSKTQPNSTNALICTTQASGVEFIDDNKVVYQFASQQFEDRGELACPPP